MPEEKRSSFPPNSGWRQCTRLTPPCSTRPKHFGRAIGRSSRWVMDHWISNDALDVRREGDFIGIPGWVVIKWVRI